jgi:hypothetical protein
MIDGITLTLPPGPGQGVDWLQKLDPAACRTDVSSATGRIKNMRIRVGVGGATIQGSLPKFFQGENISPLDRRAVAAALEALGGALGFDLGEAAVRSLEVGVSVIVKEQPGKYIDLFGNLPRYSRNDYHNSRGILECRSYFTKTGPFGFSLYDKVAEMAGKPTPELFKGCDVLRLELRIKKAAGLTALMGQNLTAADLSDYAIYRRLQGHFLRFYEDIPKTGRIVYSNMSERETAAGLTAKCAEAFRQGNRAAYDRMLAGSFAAGCMTRECFDRIRAADRKRGGDWGVSYPGPLLAELDDKVRTYCEFTA